MKATNDTQNVSIPSMIEGIPTAKWATKERRNLIIGYYDHLWKQLQQEVNSNYITNEFLKADVYIVKGESDKKAKNNSAHNWRSTYAVKHLYEIVQYARAKEDAELYAPIDSATQKKNGYKQVVMLYYHFENVTNSLLDFWVKLTIGIKTGGKHIQYAVNKVDVEA